MKEQIEQMIAQYGWSLSNYSQLPEDRNISFDLHNRKGKLVVNVVGLGNGYKMYDQAGNKLMSGHGQIVASTERLMKEYYFCTKV
jgi:hypothetical protein